MSLSDRTAYPVLFGSVPGAWVSAVLFGGAQTRNAAAELTGSWVLAAGSSFLVKHLLRRARPFRREPDIVARTGYVGARSIDQYSFPSGHAALASAVVTSAILSYPKWYVIAPGAAWVGSVSISRIWLGVHYPSDVAAGLVLGTAAGFLSSRLLGEVFD
jgi:membrane-associated phospholipid phosphatase